MAKHLKRKNSAAPFTEVTEATEIDYKDADALSAFLQGALRKVNRPLRMDELLRIIQLPRKAKKRVESALYALQEQGRAERVASMGKVAWAAPGRVRSIKGQVRHARHTGSGPPLPGKRGPGGKAAPNFWKVAAQGLEDEESPQAQERITKGNNGIPGPFPAEILDELQGLPGDPQEADIKGSQEAGFAGRRDVRDVAFVTIDGRAARDFDDAIHVEAVAGDFRLRVAIADVSHYVRRGSPLDAEARERGNSYYFPLSVEPMLPEALSNGLCSLKPGVPRLAMVADLSFSASGARLGAEFYPASIVSRARLTYGQIQRSLLLHEEEEEKNLASLLPMLREAEKLARVLLERRQERGALDFDLPEATYLFDEQGELCGVTARERHFGHRMIEEFMIAANEAVAEFLEARDMPALYRVHQPPDPDKLAVLGDFLVRTGLAHGRGGGKTGKSGRGHSFAKNRGTFTGGDLRRILEQSRGTPSAYVITRLALRSMMQARYQPENDGHFGLALGSYCHFTSPIRRYADLVVHRALKMALGLAIAGEKPLSRGGLEAVADHINATERTATEAEREIHKRLSVLFLRERVGESFDAVISGLTDFGLFVELPEFLCEGLVRLASLEDDYYDYLEERQEIRGRRIGRTFRLGRAVRVTLTDVNLSRQELNFIFEEGPGEEGAGTRRLKKGAGSRRAARAR